MKTFQGLDSFLCWTASRQSLVMLMTPSEKKSNFNCSLEVGPEKQVTFSVETPEVYQQINATLIVHPATDFRLQLKALKALSMSEMYELRKEINRLRENINKRDQNTGENNLYQEYKIKNY